MARTLLLILTAAALAIPAAAQNDGDAPSYPLQRDHSRETRDLPARPDSTWSEIPSPEPAPDERPATPGRGPRLFLRFGVGTHLATSNFVRHQESAFLSADVGLLLRDGRGGGWSLAATGFSNPDSWSFVGLKGLHRWPLTADGKIYVQAGPGLLLGGDNGQGIGYTFPGYLLEAEFGIPWISLTTNVIAQPYTWRQSDDFLIYTGNPPELLGPGTQWSLNTALRLNDGLGVAGFLALFLVVLHTLANDLS